MRVCGFTIVRNAIKYDYPIREAILSVLPVVDTFIVAVGDSEDETRKLIESINSDKIQIIDTVWDLNLREGGQLLAKETNRCFDAIDNTFDWCFYIQGDEVIHEQYHEAIKEGMKEYLNNNQVEGLLFDYVHFYGSYDYVGNSRRWYRKEVRIIRNDKTIRSYRDAQGFRKHGNKLKVKSIPAKVFHYGWVKPPEAQQEKQNNFHKMWHDDETAAKMAGTSSQFDYSSIDSLAVFSGSHPSVMQNRIQNQNWKFEYDTRKIKLSVKDRFLLLIEKLTGWRPGEYRNYIEI